jgi:AraC family transcriptional regulator
MEMPTIEKKEIKTKVIYIRFRGSYLEFRRNSLKMYKELLSYATKHNLIKEEETKVLTIYHDNPFITEEKNLRTSVAMTVPMEFNSNDNEKISTMIISGKFAILHFNLSLKEYEEAWKYTYQDWLFKSKEKPRDSFPFELYVTKPPRNFKDKSLTDIYVPIE